jgi:hypothetical protein
MTERTPEYIATHPDEFGFTFVERPVKTDGRNGMTVGNAQIPVVNNVTLFVTTFGEGLILRGLNGSNSPRVMAQGIARRKLVKNRTYGKDALRIDVVRAMLAMRNVPYFGGETVTKFVVVLNGEKHTFASEAEMDAYIEENA